VILRSALDALASVLFAAPCRICDAPLLTASRIPICPACLSSFNELAEPLCPCCGRPQLAGTATMQSATPERQHTSPSSEITPHLCRLCRARTFAFCRARNWAAYNPALTSAIMLLKYDAVTRLGNFFAARLADLHTRLSQSDAAVWRADAIVPVPLHADRRRERGYNQVDLIARPFAKRLKLPFRPYLLARTKPRPPRLVLSRSEHWDSVRGAYAIRQGSRVDKLRILLIDDVMTTGATLDACSRALLAAGAAEIVALTVGRAIPRQDG
jgi:ComF family protein